LILLVQKKTEEENDSYPLSLSELKGNHSKKKNEAKKKRSFQKFQTSQDEYFEKQQSKKYNT